MELVQPRTKRLPRPCSPGKPASHPPSLLGQVRSSLHRRRGTCPSSSSRVLQDGFEPFAKIRFFDLPLAFRDPHSVRLPCPEQLQREDGSRCSAALATVLDLYGLSWFCSFTVASH